MNRIFETSIRHGKARPDLTGTDEHHVDVTIYGAVEDERFLRFLEGVGEEQLALFGTEHFLVLDLVRRGEAIPQELRGALQELARRGVVEHVGRGRGTKYILSRSLYEALGELGTYSRERGLDRDTNKELLRAHLRRRGDGSPMAELRQVLPSLTRFQVLALLKELQRAGEIHLEGRGRGAKWNIREGG